MFWTNTFIYGVYPNHKNYKKPPPLHFSQLKLIRALRVNYYAYIFILFFTWEKTFCWPFWRYFLGDGHLFPMTMQCVGFLLTKKSWTFEKYFIMVAFIRSLYTKLVGNVFLTASGKLDAYSGFFFILFYL